jgi:tetratricopeptide (TPR) repeat protein
MSRYYAKAVKGLWIALALTLSARPASAQSPEHPPDRPELPQGADRNDPWSYYRLGQDALRKDPEKAADAFYWAARLNPVWAEPYYGRRVALLLRDPRRLSRYMRGDKGVMQSKETRAIDSLYLHALTLNPFLGPQLDHLILQKMIDQFSTDYANRTGASPGDVAFELQKYLSQGPPEWRAVTAYREGRFEDALDLYAKAISQSHDKGPIMAERGRLFYQIGQHDSALVELTRALQEMRKADKKDLVIFYQSKALMEERIGLIQRVKGNRTAAREAFGRALEEDLSYYPAHVQLAYLGLEAGDTAAVINEMDLAIQIKPDDAGIRFEYGYALGAIGRLKEAEPQLRKAIELDPDFAAAHFVLADVLQASGRRVEALKEFQAFLSLAGKSDPRREEASQMAALLGGAQ